MLQFIQHTDIIVISSEPFGSDKIRTSRLMALMAQGKRVYFFAKPIIGMSHKATFYYNKESHQVIFVQPFLPAEVSVFDRGNAMIELMKDFMKDEGIKDFTIWTDTEQGMPFIRKLNPGFVVYDKTSPEMKFGNKLEQELLGRADIVLSGIKNTEEVEIEIIYLNSDHHEASLPFASVTELVMEQRCHHHHQIHRQMISRYLA